MATAQQRDKSRRWSVKAAQSRLLLDEDALVRAAGSGNVQQLAETLAGTQPYSLASHVSVDGLPLLSCATISGNEECVGLLLSKGASPTMLDADGRSPLHWACLHDTLAASRASIVERLLRAGADATIADRDGVSPLHLAAACPDGAVIPTLLRHTRRTDVDLNTLLDAQGMCPLHWAAARGRVSNVRELLKAGASPFVQCATGRAPSHVAIITLAFVQGKLRAAHRRLNHVCEQWLPSRVSTRGTQAKGLVESAAALLGDQNPRPSVAVDAQSKNALHLAVELRLSRRVIRRLCRDAPQKVLATALGQSDSTFEHLTPPGRALVQRNWGHVQEFTRTGRVNAQSPAAPQVPLICRAVTMAPPKMIKILVGSNAPDDLRMALSSEDGDGNAAWALSLRPRTRPGVLSMVRKTIDLRTAQDSRCRTALLAAASGGRAAMVRELWEEDEMWKTDATSQDLLLAACEGGDLDIIQAIQAKTQQTLENAQDSLGNTALHLAAASGHASLVSHLLEQGIPCDARNMYGESPLHLACKNNHMTVVKLLVDAHVARENEQHPNSTYKQYDRMGSPLFHWACHHQSMDMLESLLAAAVTPNVVDLRPPARSTLDLALLLSDGDVTDPMVTRLLDIGAKSAEELLLPSILVLQKGARVLLDKVHLRQANVAATVIQRWFRHTFQRRDHLGLTVRARAATLIQAHFRGYLARKYNKAVAARVKNARLSMIRRQRMSRIKEDLASPRLGSGDRRLALNQLQKDRSEEARQRQLERRLAAADEKGLREMETRMISNAERRRLLREKARRLSYIQSKLAQQRKAEAAQRALEEANKQRTIRRASLSKNLMQAERQRRADTAATQSLKAASTQHSLHGRHANSHPSPAASAASPGMSDRMVSHVRRGLDVVAPPSLRERPRYSTVESRLSQKPAIIGSLFASAHSVIV